MGSKNIVGLHKHHWHRCDDGNCFICVGGLGYCNICGGAEGTLTTDCGYVRLDSVAQDKIMNGEIDYKRGLGWFVCNPVNNEDGVS